MRLWTCSAAIGIVSSIAITSPPQKIESAPTTSSTENLAFAPPSGASAAFASITSPMSALAPRGRTFLVSAREILIRRTIPILCATLSLQLL